MRYPTLALARNLGILAAPRPPRARPSRGLLGSPALAALRRIGLIDVRQQRVRFRDLQEAQRFALAAFAVGAIVLGRLAPLRREAIAPGGAA